MNVLEKEHYGSALLGKERRHASQDLKKRQEANA